MLTTTAMMLKPAAGLKDAAAPLYAAGEDEPAAALLVPEAAGELEACTGTTYMVLTTAVVLEAATELPPLAVELP